MHILRLAGLGLSLASGLMAGSAAAAWPGKITGTYNGGANTASVKLQITSQDGGTPCAGISGVLTDTGQNITDPVAGYYCPKSGAVAFVRKDPTSLQTFQVYHGSFAQTTSPKANKLAGEFGEYDAVGNLGEFPFEVSN